MISLSNLRTSQIERLADRLSEGLDLDEFLQATKSFLSAFIADGGADEDLIFVTGKRLSSHDIWDSVPAQKLRLAVADVPARRIEVFLERAPKAYRQIVLPAKVAEAASLPVAKKAGRSTIFVRQRKGAPIKKVYASLPERHRLS